MRLPSLAQGCAADGAVLFRARVYGRRLAAGFCTNPRYICFCFQAASIRYTIASFANPIFRLPAMPPSSDRTKLAAALFLLLFAAVKIAMLHWWTERQPQDKPLRLSDCNAAGAGCPFGGGAMLRLSGVGGTKTPFAVEVSGLPEDAPAPAVSFAMQGMDMGFNRFELQPQGGGRWRLDNVRLPFCALSRKDWLVEWQAGGQRYQAAFETR